VSAILFYSRECGWFIRKKARRPGTHTTSF